MIVQVNGNVPTHTCMQVSNNMTSQVLILLSEPALRTPPFLSFPKPCVRPSQAFVSVGESQLFGQEAVNQGLNVQFFRGLFWMVHHGRLLR